MSKKTTEDAKPKITKSRVIEYEDMTEHQQNIVDAKPIGTFPQGLSSSERLEWLMKRAGVSKNE